MSGGPKANSERAFISLNHSLIERDGHKIVVWVRPCMNNQPFGKMKKWMFESLDIQTVYPV